MIHVIGDSHTVIYSESTKILETGKWHNFGEFNILHLGPITAYKVLEKQMAIEAAMSVPAGDPLIFSFGEIDCRCKVHAHQNLDEIQQRYFEFIQAQPNRNVILTNVSPCLKEEPWKDWFDQPENKDIWFSTKGSLSERNSYKRKFSNSCRDFCMLNGYKYIDYWDLVIGNGNLYMDDIHLGHESGVKEFVLKNII